MANYLYNGIELPDINAVWTDNETYPYAYITEGTPCRLILKSSKLTIYTTTGNTNVTTTNPYSNYVVYELVDGAWVGVSYSGTFRVLWCSADLYYAGVLSDDTDSELAGTLYLAASSPIPVTTWTPDPIPMTMGWLVGRRVAGQRGKKIEPEVPSGVYDDTFPIEWNTLAVQGNPTLTCGDPSFVKVSNLTPTAGEMAGMVIASTFGGSLFELPYTDGHAFDLGHVANYGLAPVLRVIVVTTAGQSAETECDFPKTGIYVENYGLDGTDISIAIKYAPKTPIAYLYNGVQLPDINTVWTDKETYPYAVIRQMADGSYCLYLCSAVATYGKTLVSYYAKYPTGSYCISYNCSGDSWISDTQWLPSSSTITVGDSNNPAMWSNHDIMNTDGTTYLAASDPVPVYES